MLAACRLLAAGGRAGGGLEVADAGLRLVSEGAEGVDDDPEDHVQEDQDHLHLRKISFITALTIMHPAPQYFWI